MVTFLVTTFGDMGSCFHSLLLVSQNTSHLCLKWTRKYSNSYIWCCEFKVIIYLRKFLSEKSVNIS